MDRKMKDQYRHPHDGNKAIEPLDLPLPPPRSPDRREVITTPRREIRLSASTVDLPSSRTISTVTNPEYELDPLSHKRLSDRKSREGSESGDIDRGNDDEEVDDEDSRRLAPGTEISRLLSRALSQENNGNSETELGERSFATQYLESILRSSSHVDSQAQRREESQESPDSENLSDSYHAPTDSSGSEKVGEDSESEREGLDEEHDLNDDETSDRVRVEEHTATVQTPQNDLMEGITNNHLYQQPSQLPQQQQRYLSPETDTPGPSLSLSVISSHPKQAMPKMKFTVRSLMAVLMITSQC
jgi:hypothetical protein